MRFDNVAIVLGIISLLISGLALWISMGSDRRMQAIASLDFHEKLAVMASHLRNVKQDYSPLRAEQIKNDFAAASSLLRYVTDADRQQMIRDYIVPILNTYLAHKVDGGLAITVRQIIEVALPYEIETAKLYDMRQRVRGLEGDNQTQA